MQWRNSERMAENGLETYFVNPCGMIILGCNKNNTVKSYLGEGLN